MKQLLQRAMVLILVASMAAWSQAEVCPMKLQSQRANACAAASMHQHAAPDVAEAGHDCCPRGAMHKSAHKQCPPVQLSADNAAMTCCSIDPQPIDSPNIPSVTPQIAVITILDGPAVPERNGQLEPQHSTGLENSVFRLKEDLRI